MPARRLLAMAALSACACSAAPASYPDHSRVAAAEAGWCKALAKYEAAQDLSWRHTGACLAGSPTGSAPFIAAMTACYLKHHEEHGDNSLDMGALTSNCADEALSRIDVRASGASEALAGRCARMLRCEKVAKADCLAAFEELDPLQKAALTAMYNQRAQHQIAECLASADCGKGEDAAMTQCYEDAQRQRVWLPSL